jgi:hypothetical protein
MYSSKKKRKFPPKSPIAVLAGTFFMKSNLMGFD